MTICHMENFSTWQSVMWRIFPHDNLFCGEISPHSRFFLHGHLLWCPWRISSLGMRHDCLYILILHWKVTWELIFNAIMFGFVPYISSWLYLLILQDQCVRHLRCICSVCDGATCTICKFGNTCGWYFSEHEINTILAATTLNTDIN